MLHTYVKIHRAKINTHVQPPGSRPTLSIFDEERLSTQNIQDPIESLLPMFPSPSQGWPQTILRLAYPSRSKGKHTDGHTCTCVQTPTLVSVCTQADTHMSHTHHQILCILCIDVSLMNTRIYLCTHMQSNLYICTDKQYTVLLHTFTIFTQIMYILHSFCTVSSQKHKDSF